MKEIPNVRVPDTVPDGTSPYIAASIRQSQLEREQQRALDEVLKQMFGENTHPEWRMRLLRAYKNQEKKRVRTDRRRARLAGVRCEAFTRAEIIRRDGRCCYLCGKKDLADEQIHIDHMTPISRGGDHSRANVSVACSECNTAKGSLTVSEYRAKLFS